MSPLPELLTTEDVANYLKVDVVTVRRLVKRGELQAYRVGNEYRFTENDVLEFLTRQRTQEIDAVQFIRLRQNFPPEFVAEVMPLLYRQAARLRGETGESLLKRFTQRARQVFTLAAEASEKRGESVITSLHLLYGIRLETGGVGQHVLNALEITADKITPLLSPMVENAETPIPPGLDDGTKKALERAVEAAKKLQHRYMGTEHLLLGLLDDDQIVQTLAQFDVTPDRVREEVDKMLNLPRLDTSSDD